MIVAHEPTREPKRVESEAVRASLLDSISWWSAKARSEAVPSDRVWVCFSCTSCDALFDRVLRIAPDAAPDAGRLYRSLDDVDALLDEVLGARSRHVDATEWRAAAECVCRAPHHLRSTVGAGLFHSVLGSGAGVAIARFGGTTTWLRCPDGGGALEPLDPAAFRSVFGRPLTLFDAWGEVALKLPLEPSTVVGTQAEPGVWLLAAASTRALEHGIRAKVGHRSCVIVDIEPATIEGGAWPSELRSIARAIEDGAKAALVVERAAILAQSRAWARSVLRANVRTESDESWVLVTEKGEWPLLPTRIALAMATLGRTLGESAARELAQAAREIDDRLDTLQALTAIVPGSSFEVVGTTATARLADGTSARTIDLAHIPRGAQALAPDLLAREAAFLFDVAPPWAERSRVCPCGAASSTEARLVPWPWAGDPTARPRVVRILAEDGRPGAAEVVALACDRHVRIPSERELAQLGIDDRRLAACLDADLGRTRVRVQVSTWNGPEGERVLVARAPFVSGVVLSDARARSLCEAAGRPFRDRATGWAVGSHIALLLDAGASEALAVRALSELGISGAEPFWLRRDIDLTVDALGSFEVVVDRR